MAGRTSGHSLSSEKLGIIFTLFFLIPINIPSSAALDNLVSVYKSSDNKIFNNQEVINIIKALGLELNIKTSKLEYSAAKLRYGKIILCTDAE